MIYLMKSHRNCQFLAAKRRKIDIVRGTRELPVGFQSAIGGPTEKGVRKGATLTNQWVVRVTPNFQFL